VDDFVRRHVHRRLSRIQTDFVPVNQLGHRIRWHIEVAAAKPIDLTRARNTRIFELELEMESREGGQQAASWFHVSEEEPETYRTGRDAKLSMMRTPRMARIQRRPPAHFTP